MNSQTLETLKNRIEDGRPIDSEPGLSYYDWETLVHWAAAHGNERAGRDLLGLDYEAIGIDESVLQDGLKRPLSKAAENDMVEFGYALVKRAGMKPRRFRRLLLKLGTEDGALRAIQDDRLQWEHERGLKEVFARYGTPEFLDRFEALRDRPDWTSIVEALVVDDRQEAIEHVQDKYHDYIGQVDESEAILHAVDHDAERVLEYFYDRDLTLDEDRKNDLTRAYEDDEKGGETIPFYRDRYRIGAGLAVVAERDDVTIQSDECLRSVQSSLCRRLDSSDEINHKLHALLGSFEGSISAETFKTFYEKSSVDDEIVHRLVPMLDGQPNMEDLKEGYRDHEHFLLSLIKNDTMGSANTAFCWLCERLDDHEYRDEMLLSLGSEKIRTIVLNIADTKTLATDDVHEGLFRAALDIVDDPEFERTLATKALQRPRVPLIRALSKRNEDAFEVADPNDHLSEDLLQSSTDLYDQRLAVYSALVEAGVSLPDEHYVELLNEENITKDKAPSVTELIRRRDEYPGTTLEALLDRTVTINNKVGPEEARAIAESSLRIQQRDLFYLHKTEPEVIRTIMQEYARQEDDPAKRRTALTGVFVDCLSHHVTRTALLRDLIDMGASINGVDDPAFDGSFSSDTRRQAFEDRTHLPLSELAQSDFPEDNAVGATDDSQPYRKRMLNFMLTEGVDPDAQRQEALTWFIMEARPELFNIAAQRSDLKNGSNRDLLDYAIRHVSGNSNDEAMKRIMKRLIEAGCLRPEHVDQAVEAGLGDDYVVTLSEQLQQRGHMPPKQTLKTLETNRPDLYERLKDDVLNRRSEQFADL